MRDAIVEKLREELRGPIERESQIVYILVEIRKYLDHIDPAKKEYKILRTYCHWAVHISLGRSGARDILQSLDEALATSGSQEVCDKAMKTAHDIFSLQWFQHELGKFLHSNGMPVDLVNDPHKWGRFLKLYVSVVSDCPFDFTKNSDSFRAINKAVLRIRELPDDVAEGNPRYGNIAWEWKLNLLDGSTRNFSCTYGYLLQ